MKRLKAPPAIRATSLLAILTGLLLGTALGLAPPEAAAQEEGHAHDPTSIWTISRGGQLYDKWWEVIEATSPKESHPAYPAAGKKKGSAT